MSWGPENIVFTCPYVSQLTENLIKDVIPNIKSHDYHMCFRKRTWDIREHVFDYFFFFFTVLNHSTVANSRGIAAMTENNIRILSQWKLWCFLPTLSRQNQIFSPPVPWARVAASGFTESFSSSECLKIFLYLSFIDVSFIASPSRRCV